MTILDWCPFADTRRKSPNYTPGRSGQRIKAVVMHIASGGYDGSINWLCNPSVKASAHFMIAKDGRIAQMVGINQTAWGNGLQYKNGRWYDPEGHAVTPAWGGLVIPINPNSMTLSVEHEGQPNEVWTPAMFDANTKLLKWIAEQTGLVYTPHSSLIGHNELSPVSRPYCPGPNANLQKMADAANPPVKLTTYVVNTTGTSYIRQGPAVAYPIVEALHLGDTIVVDKVITGQDIKGNNQWGHVSSGLGFVSMTVLKEVVP